jgi:uncharacterized protein with GYD domain
VFFIHLIKLKRQLTKEDIEEMDRASNDSKYSLKVHSIHYTLGRYDVVIYSEGPDEKSALQACFDVSDVNSTETLVAIPREEALKALGLR